MIINKYQSNSKRNIYYPYKSVSYGFYQVPLQQPIIWVFRQDTKDFPRFSGEIDEY